MLNHVHVVSQMLLEHFERQREQVHYAFVNTG
jgi:hypothetical protein